MKAASGDLEDEVELCLRVKMSTIPGPSSMPFSFGQQDQGEIPRDLHAKLFGGPLLDTSTFALLDAAKLPFLPEFLAGSGLDYCCLFKGQAAEDMGDVAPWLVRLEAGHSFVSSLFTDSDMSHHLWRPALGVFIRSAVSLVDLRTHLRHFTIVRSLAGSAFYLRYWDPDMLAHYVHEFAAAPTSLQQSFLSLAGVPLDVVCLASDSNWHIQTENITGAQADLNEAVLPTLNPGEMAFFERYRHLILVESVVDTMQKVFPDHLAGENRAALRDTGMAVVSDMKRYGFEQSTQLRHLVGWGLFYGRGFEHKDREGILQSICRSDTDALTKFTKFSLRMHSFSGGTA